MSSPRKESAVPAETAPFATVLDAAGRRLLAAVNPAAAAAGLAPGMPLADALSFVPGLATAVAEPAKDAAALRRLAEWCGRYSPWTAPDGADGVKIEITGCAHLWGGEEGLAADLTVRLARQGIAGRLAVADTLGAAWAYARFAETGRDVVILASSETDAALAPLPVEALRLDPATAQGLRRVGLKRIGDLYAMPRAALARRFGETVARRLDQALDKLPEPLSPLGETPARRVRLSFAEPIADPADLALAAERLTLDLVTRLAREGTGARRLMLAFHRVDGRVERIVLGTARPSRDPHHLAALFKERLDTIDPGLGVEDMILAAFAVDRLAPEQIDLPRLNPGQTAENYTRTYPSLVIPAKAGNQEQPAPRSEAPCPSQGQALDPRFRGDDEKKQWGATEVIEGSVAALLDRLGNRLGLAAVARLEARESHIPERASIAISMAHPSAPFPSLPRMRGRARVGAGSVAVKPSGAELKPPRPIWLFDPPRPIRLFDPPQPVEASWLLPDDPPFRFTWRRQAHRVRCADGPERVAVEWWRPETPAAVSAISLPGTQSAGADAIRDYYRVEDEAGRRFWLFRTGLPGGGDPLRWYIHGVFA
jgi:protein ImuB